MAPPKDLDLDLDPATIVGIVIGSVAAACLLAVLIYIVYKCVVFRRTSRRKQAQHNVEAAAFFKNQQLEREAAELHRRESERIVAHYVPREVSNSEISELSPVCSSNKRASELESPQSTSTSSVGSFRRSSEVRRKEVGSGVKDKGPFELESPIVERRSGVMEMREIGEEENENGDENEKTGEWEKMLQKH